MAYSFDFCPNCGSNKIPCGCEAALWCRWCSRRHHPKVACEARIKGIERIARDAMSKAKEQEKTMTAPTEAQLKDPKWWDENAPRLATHIDLKRMVFCNSQGTWEGSAQFWNEDPLQDDWFTDRYFPRPPQPPAPEWDGEGKPPAGWAGECTWGQKQNWFECVSLPGNFVALFKYSGWSIKHWAPSENFEFRPLRTAEQRQREKVIIKASQSIQSFDGISMRQSTSEELAVHLYDAGMLRKGDE